MQPEDKQGNEQPKPYPEHLVSEFHRARNEAIGRLGSDPYGLPFCGFISLPGRLCHLKVKLGLLRSSYSAVTL